MRKNVLTRSTFLFARRLFTDIDECDYDPDDDQERLCPGVCRNTIGSYTCIDPDEEISSCEAGYEISEDAPEEPACRGT